MKKNFNLLFIFISDDALCIEEFKQFCKNELQNKNVMTLPKIDTILDHPFFTHDFIIIYSFLTELALKTESERQIFFTDLVSRLKAFPEEIVARQLGELLLSRLVLLDNTACKHLLPYVLKPKQGKYSNLRFDRERIQRNIMFELFLNFRKYNRWSESIFCGNISTKYCTQIAAYILCTRRSNKTFITQPF